MRKLHKQCSLSDARKQLFSIAKEIKADPQMRYTLTAHETPVMVVHGCAFTCMPHEDPDATHRRAELVDLWSSASRVADDDMLSLPLRIGERRGIISVSRDENTVTYGHGVYRASLDDPREIHRAQLFVECIELYGYRMEQLSLDALYQDEDGYVSVDLAAFDAHDMPLFFCAVVCDDKKTVLDVSMKKLFRILAVTAARQRVPRALIVARRKEQRFEFFVVNPEKFPTFDQWVSGGRVHNTVFPPAHSTHI